ncbi:glycosyltransferase family 2 protein [Komagataeibacter melaceti]|uniref:Glycosyltransferase family 2 protein n=1 Tax=Komagataeibacter melaceti TaxID=2766577 RepID=A0A371Z4V0_9PROT|nr:glycosyltransferase family 2 protein [Komagataeibacter melaceti]RFD21497.1 glycosyltransferase family 2 protein [Komagataeibacter melaceti]
MTASIPAVSIVICTYDRPELLERAVGSCADSIRESGLAAEIVISDNGTGGYAPRLAARYAQAPFDVRCVTSAPGNISVARNAGIAAARAEIVAFLDDDMEVGQTWLRHLHETLQASGADIAIGPVRPRFAGGSAPLWDPEGGRYTRVLDRPDGAQLILEGRQRVRGWVISTASSIWRRGTCFTDREPFDPAFGACGGEDLDLFLRVARRGRRIVWCGSALAWENIPTARMQLSYQAVRAYSGGQVYAGIYIRHAAHPFVRAADIMLRGAIQVVMALIRIMTLLPRFVSDRLQPDPDMANTVLLLAGAAGKIMWRNRIPLYHMEHANLRDGA